MTTTARVLRLHIDGLPDAQLSKNNRRSSGLASWAIQSRQVKDERERAAWLLKEALMNHDGRPYFDDEWMFKAPVALTFTVCFGDKRRRDLDGWASALAPWIDAMVDLGILVDDSTRYVRSLTVAVEDGQEQGMAVEVRGLEGA